MVSAVGRRFVHPRYHCGRRAYQFPVDVNLPAVGVRLDNDCHANPLAVIPAGVRFKECSDAANPFGRFLWVGHCPPADGMVCYSNRFHVLSAPMIAPGPRRRPFICTGPDRLPGPGPVLSRTKGIVAP